jgi:acylpyruvate hydrolase
MSSLALAVDMTARNLQDRVRKAGLPWSAAKGFDTFTPIGLDFYPFTPRVMLNSTSAV